MATSAKKSVLSTGAQKSYGKGQGKGPAPAASGAGMDKNAQSDHAQMVRPANQQLGRSQPVQAPQAPQAPQGLLASDPFISDLTS